MLFTVAYLKVQFLETDGTFVLTWIEKNSTKHYFVAHRICTEERVYVNIKYINTFIMN